MSHNNFKQKVNKYLKKFGNTNLVLLSKFSIADFEADFLLKVSPTESALRLLENEGYSF